ncbi:MAG: hypothetical protein ACK52X_01125, partial [bacterium]
DKIQRDPGMNQNKWVDMSFLIEPTYRGNNYLIRLSCNLISSNNAYWTENVDKLNLSTKLQVSYTIN